MKTSIFTFHFPLSLTLLLLFSFNTFAQSNIDWVKVHNLTSSGIEKLYDLRTKEALTDFNEAINLAPNDPRGYFFKCIAFYYRYFILYEENDYHNFMKESEKVIKICEDYLDNQEDSKMYFYLGGIKGYRGIIQSIYAKGMPPLSVLKEGKDAYSYLQKALELNKENYDAYMGLGLFTYIIGGLHNAAKWIISILGFKGDKELGIKYLQIAYEKGLYTKYEAMWWLTFIYMGQNNDELASKNLETVLKKFPDNNLFLLLNGNFQLGMGNVEKALFFYQKSEIVYTEDSKKLTRYGGSGTGTCYYFKGDYEKAINKFQEFLNNVSEKEDRWRNRDHALYLTAVSYEILGDTGKAKEFYSKVKNNEFAKLRLLSPLSKNQIEILKNYNLAYSQNFSDGINKLNLLSENTSNDDEKALAFYYLGELYKIKKDYQTALGFYKKTINLNIKIEDWIKPYSHFNIGLIYKNLEQFELAKTEFGKIGEYKNFFNKRRLQHQVENAEADL